MAKFNIKICPNVIRTVSDFLQYIEKEKSGHKPDYLFRGQTSDWPLQPGLSRCGPKTKEGLLNLERIMHDEFARTAPFSTVSLADKWDRLALSQHHGLPTRLLDWTYSAIFALWAAVKDDPKEDANKNPLDGVVWIIKSEVDDFIQGDDFKTDPFKVTRTRIFRPRIISDRIAAQSGVFTLHVVRDHDVEPILRLERNKFFRHRLIKIPIKSEDFLPLREQLDRCGINHSTMFPDLDGLCRHLRWRYTRRK